MPFLDVTDVLLDPDFVDLSLVCYRQVQTVDEDNFPTNTAQAIPFSGVVTVDRSLEAKRMAAGAKHQWRHPHCYPVQANSGDACQ